MLTLSTTDLYRHIEASEMRAGKPEPGVVKPAGGPVAGKPAGPQRLAGMKAAGPGACLPVSWLATSLAHSLATKPASRAGLAPAPVEVRQPPITNNKPISKLFYITCLSSRMGRAPRK